MADLDDDEEVITTLTLPHISGEGVIPTMSYISAGCNRDPNCTVWTTQNSADTTGFVIYGAGRLVCIYDVSAAIVTATLRGHKHRVNAVAVIKHETDKKELEILTGSTDSHILHWRYNITSHTYTLLQIMTQHTECVTALSVTHPHQFISISTDGTLRVWSRRGYSQEWENTQIIDTGRSRIMACVTSHIWHLQGQQVYIMAVGGVDCKIHLYMSTVDGQYEPLLSLEGHEDWLRCLTFCTTDTGSLMLASSSQDRRIRLWNIDIRHAENEMHVTDGVSTSFGSRGYVVTWHNIEIIVLLDAVLTGHEDWVLAVKWHPIIRIDNKSHQPLTLLSSSTDKTMIIWKPDPVTAIYTPWVRVGEVGGHTLGFYGCQFSPNGRRILANGYSGCFHLWEQPDTNIPTQWIPSITVSGHAQSVMDCTWDQSYNYLLTTSGDQTTRVIAPWKQQLKERTDIPHPRWFEIARPQIHGYDLNCITSIPGIPHRFASGADEKIVRIFLAPEPFILSLQTLSNISTEHDDAKRAVRSTLPELGLSNKGLTKETKKHTYKDLVSPVPPAEDHLINTTLWPEIEKLYGHGYEVICVTCNHRGTLLASACVSKKAKYAVIRIWETKEWTEIAQLESHQLTVVQLEFSHNDQYLLSVSRDRHLSVFSINESSSPMWSLQSRIKAHARIIWSCSWTHDDDFFATGARDKKVKIWRQAQPEESKTDPWILDSSLPDFTSAVTAVAFSPAISDRYVLAVGMEDGRIELYTAPIAKSKLEWSCLSRFDTDICHALTVRRLRWRIHKSLNEITTNSNDFDLASCSADTSVRIFHVDLNARITAST